MNSETITEELALFADIATEPRCTVISGGFVVSLNQGGDQVTLSFSGADGSGIVNESRNGAQVRHASYRSLLASPQFGSVQALARLQAEMLRREFESQDFLEINGEIIRENRSQPADLEEVDNALCETSSSGLRVLLLDGPAGIGKTHLIERLVFRRASNYRPGSAPPILHIQSHGRVMTWLPDRIASTLQDFRSLRLTYEQLPILVRHGLIQVAIDGFDELADPAGYEQSWASLRAFVESCTGEGTVVLAGRDTFLGVERLRRALITVDDQSLTAVRLRSVDAAAARAWLRRHGWSHEQIDVASEWGLFDESSYVLRPYFLAQLAKVVLAQEDFETFAQYPLAFLVEMFLTRETQKLSGVIELTVAKDALRTATRAFYEEVARTMADYETESLDIPTLQLMANVAFDPLLRGDDLQRIKHRIESISLLEKEGEGSRRFAHSEVQNYFLSSGLIKLIGNGELPKAIIRNVCGTDLLRTFSLTAPTVESECARAFLKKAFSLLKGRYSGERTARNLASLVVAASPVAGLVEDAIMEDVSLDDAVIEGVAGTLALRYVTINQLDIRGANLKRIVFRDCQIASVIGDDITVLPDVFPQPSFAQITEGSGRQTLIDRSDIDRWIVKRQGKAEGALAGETEDLRHPLVALTERACRVMLRQYWIRNLAQDRAGRLVGEPEWPIFENLLLRHELLRKEARRAASGGESYFFHIKQPREILLRNMTDPKIRGFWNDVRATIGAPPLPPLPN